MHEALIITIGASMFQKKSYRHWLTNFLNSMLLDDCTYWMHLATRPKQNPAYVYLCIGGKIRFRAHFVRSHGPSQQSFGDYNEFRNAWIELCGPVVRPERPVIMKGFRGFRYSEKLF